PPYDAGPPPYDAGPPPYDAGPPPYDAGPPPYDAGPPPYDGGPTPDAGFPDAGFPDAGVTDGGPPPPPTPPVYPGTCPVFTNGNNSNFLSAGQSRSFLMTLPANPVGAGVVFVWHWLGGNPTDATNWMGYSTAAGTDPVIVIAPNSCCSSGEWQTGVLPPNNVDIEMFDDVLACLSVQYNVDMNRVWSVGHSAGALFTTFLMQHRANYLASVAALSGGQLGGFTVPQSPIPALLVWGGPTDTYGSFSFETATLNLSNNLQNNGHFVVHCSGTFGHQLPPGQPFTWEFLRDHPRGVQPEPYQFGLPPTLPSYCFIPP
ncbi:MAG: hypothetical protein RIT81_38055, partial [Deltaproteobacteria bacterium]